MIFNLEHSGSFKIEKRSPPPTNSPSTGVCSPSAGVCSPKVIPLSSQGEVAIHIQTLHKRYAALEVMLRKTFDDLIDTGQLKLKDIVRQAASYLQVPMFKGISDVDELFDALLSHCNFFNCDVLDNLVQKLPHCQLQNDFSDYMKSICEFSESTQLKLLRSAIKEKLSAIHQHVIIKLEDRWENITIGNLKRVFEHYFGPETSNTFHHIHIDYGSLIVTFSLPTDDYHSQSLIDKINFQRESMNRIGVLETTVNNKKPEMFEAKETIDYENSLCRSVVFGDSFETSLLLQLGANANCKNYQGKTPLILAAEHEHIALIDTLVIDGGADIYGTDNEGHTAFMIAKEKNNALLIESLHKAKQKVIYMNHVTLTKACEKGHIILVESFIEKGISVDILLPNGSTPLILACQYGHNELVQLLIKQNVSLSTLDSNGYTALHYACENGSVDIASLLLEHNAPYCLTTSGNTPLMLASQHGWLPIVELLYSYEMTRYDGLQAMLLTKSLKVLELLATKCSVSEWSTITKEQLKFLSKEEVKSKP